MVQDDEGHDGFEALQGPNDIRAVGPRARQTQIQIVAPTLRGELGVWLAGDGPPECRRSAPEVAIRVGQLVDRNHSVLIR